jgi:glycerol-3-phosphate dehydrogenase
MVTESGLITITGGKWTTYRRMAEDTVNTAITRGGLPERPCVTATLPIHGAAEIDLADPLHFHGADASAIRQLVAEQPRWGEKLHPQLPYILAEIVWAAREELCMTVEDALSRRTRSLLLDARAAIESAGIVAELLATEMNQDRHWQEIEVAAFKAVAAGYLP